MIRKILLIGIAVVVLAPFAFLAIEHWRGQRQLAATLADVRARGEVLDIEKIAPAPVPPDGNAMDAFMTATEQLSDSGEVVPQAMAVIEPGRAIPGSRLSSWEGPHRNTLTWQDLGDWVTNNGVALEELHASLAAPHRQPTLDYSQGFQLLLPHLAKMKKAVIALSASAEEAAHRNDFEGVIADLRGMQRIADDLEQHPLIIDQLVRIACAAILDLRTWDILHAQPWSAGQLAELQAAVPPRDLARGMVHAFEGERAMVLITVSSMTPAQILDMTGNGSEDVTTGKALLRQLSGVAGSLWHFGWGDQALANYLQYIQTQIDTNRLAARQHSSEPVKAFQRQGALPDSSLLASFRTIYTRMLTPALSKSMLKPLHADTERALLDTQIAVYRYQLKHGKPPAALADLVPDYLAAVPVDSMDGQPLRYRLNPDGTFTLWSVGEDLVDDGGDAALVGRASSKRWDAGPDMVWPLPATQPQIEQWQQAEKERAAREKTLRAGGTTMSPTMMRRYGLRPPTNAPAAAPSSETAPAQK